MMPDFKRNSTAVVLGASGGIGSALTGTLVKAGCFSRIYALCRTESRQKPWDYPQVKLIELDDYRETSIERAARIILSETDEIHLALAATGMLHNLEIHPEKSLDRISETALQQVFTANSITPVIFAKHFAKHMSRTSPAVMAAISARVGSISDNRLGGWYSYRASKSALNMLYKNLAIEMKRVNPNLIIGLLHPGTTDTSLSKPFQANVQAEKLFDPQMSADYLYNVVKKLNKSDSGGFFAWDGEPIEW